MYQTFCVLTQTRPCWLRSGHCCFFGQNIHYSYLLLLIFSFGLYWLGAIVRPSEVSALDIWNCHKGRMISALVVSLAFLSLLCWAFYVVMVWEEAEGVSGRQHWVVAKRPAEFSFLCSPQIEAEKIPSILSHSKLLVCRKKCLKHSARDSCERAVFG